MTKVRFRSVVLVVGVLAVLAACAPPPPTSWTFADGGLGPRTLQASPVVSPVPASAGGTITVTLHDFNGGTLFDSAWRPWTHYTLPLPTQIDTVTSVTGVSIRAFSVEGRDLKFSLRFDVVQDVVITATLRADAAPGQVVIPAITGFRVDQVSPNTGAPYSFQYVAEPGNPPTAVFTIA